MEPEVDLQARIADLEEMYKRQTKELDSLKAEIADLRACVEFYAKNEGLRIDFQTNSFQSSDSFDGKDFHGSLARECLRKWGK